MSDVRSHICVVLQRVKYVKLGASLEPLADEIIALVREAMLSEAVIEARRAGEDRYVYGEDDGWWQADVAGMEAALDEAFGPEKAS